MPFDIYCDDWQRNLRAYNMAPRRIWLNIQADPFTLDIDKAAPCALIFHELFSNALKHTFPAERSRHDRCGPALPPHQFTMGVRDSRVGVPPALDWQHTDTLGLKLISMLTEQLGGSLRLDREGGTTFTLTIPLL